MSKILKIIAPCGMLGYGYPIESFMNGIKEKPDAIIVDAGSTDAGPHKLGAGISIVSKLAVKKDLTPMIVEGKKLGIPVIIGSAGGTGTKEQVLWTLEIINEILIEKNIVAKIASIYSDFEKAEIKEALRENKIEPLTSNIKQLTINDVDDTTAIVAQMGHEPIVEALKEAPDIIVCGRAYDPAPFAGMCIFKGFDEGLAYHLGKILECGALCADPGTTKDCILGIITKDSIIVKPLSSDRKCLKTSVAAHTFYEKDHPYLLKGPGTVLNLENNTFSQITENTVEIKNSRIEHTNKYYIKLEGAKRVGFKTFVIAGIRDPLMIAKLEEIEEMAEKEVRNYFSEIPADDYQINFINYGINGVLGTCEFKEFQGHEVGLMFDVCATTQELANIICASLRSTLLHFGYKGRKSTAGNLAFPQAPSDVIFGAVYEFSIYHLMEVKNGLAPFKIEYSMGGKND